MNESSIEILYAAYRRFTLCHAIIINDSATFRRYLYPLDVLCLNIYCSPFLWEDYIFVDDDLINTFIQRNISNPIIKDDLTDFDHLSDSTDSFISRVINENLVKSIDVNTINHISHVSIEGAAYYRETKENHFFFFEDYQSRLTTKLRETNINKILE